MTDATVVSVVLFRVPADEKNSSVRYRAVATRDDGDVQYGDAQYVPQDAIHAVAKPTVDWFAVAPDPRAPIAAGPNRLLAVYAPTAEGAAAALQGLYGSAVDSTQAQDPWARRARHLARVAVIRQAALDFAGQRRASRPETVVAVLTWAEAHVVHPNGHQGDMPPTDRPMWWPAADPTGRRHAGNGAAWTAACAVAAVELQALSRLTPDTGGEAVMAALAIITPFATLTEGVAAALLAGGPEDPYTWGLRDPETRAAVVEAWAMARAANATAVAATYLPQQ